MTNLSLRNSTISFSVLIVDGNLVFLCRSSPLLYPSSGSSTGSRIQGNAVISSLSVRLLWLLNHSCGQRFPLFFLSYAVSLSWILSINGLLLRKLFIALHISFDLQSEEQFQSLVMSRLFFFPLSFVLSRTLFYYSHWWAIKNWPIDRVALVLWRHGCFLSSLNIVGVLSSEIVRKWLFYFRSEQSDI